MSITRFFSLLLVFAASALSSLYAQLVPVTFSYYNTQISRAELRGEFTNWATNPLAMTELEDGQFVVTTNLAVNSGTFVQGAQRGF
ncbi:hypothetical protein RZS08_29970, partial [Arthrospira platensis SPKY1]|nr:hypothetical protein [Arthrospira platensis SPKY1]